MPFREFDGFVEIADLYNEVATRLKRPRSVGILGGDHVVLIEETLSRHLAPATSDLSSPCRMGRPKGS